MTRFRLPDLHWQREPGRDGHDFDFPDFLEQRFSLERAVALDLSLLLVRAAYARDTATLHPLIEKANAARDASAEANKIKRNSNWELAQSTQLALVQAIQAAMAAAGWGQP